MSMRTSPDVFPCAVYDVLQMGLGQESNNRLAFTFFVETLLMYNLQLSKAWLNVQLGSKQTATSQAKKMGHHLQVPYSFPYANYATWFTQFSILLFFCLSVCLSVCTPSDHSFDNSAFLCGIYWHTFPINAPEVV